MAPFFIAFKKARDYLARTDRTRKGETAMEENTQIKEEVPAEETQEVVKEETPAESSTFETMLKTNKEFQSEHDRRVTKAIETAKGKWQAEYEAKIAEISTKAKEEAENTYKAKESEYEAKLSESEKTIKDYQTKVLILEKGVKKESVEDVLSLAQRYVTETTTLDQAIDTLLEKYPVFSASKKEAKITIAGKDINAYQITGKTPAQEYLEKRHRK